MLRLPALQRIAQSWQYKDKIHLLPSRPGLYPELFPWKKDAKDARFPWIWGKIFGCRPYQDGACMVPWEKGARRKMKRAVPALEATGEMQLMLCLPFFISAWRSISKHLQVIQYIVFFVWLNLYIVLSYICYWVLCNFGTKSTRCLSLYGVRKYKVQDTLRLLAFLCL